jgi:hypothetical protein
MIAGDMFEQFSYIILQPWVVGALCAVFMLASWQIAYRLRSRAVAMGEAQESGGVLIDEACLAILGLLLAFTFAAAYSKYDNRNSKAADDANALRTLHVRCELLPDPWRRELAPLVREAVQERLVPLKPGFDAKSIPALFARAHGNRAQMLEVIKRMNQDKDAASLSGPILDACCAAIASQEARVAAAMDHVPLPVIGLLVLVAAISAILLGRSQALVGRPRLTTVTLILMVSAIVYITLDLELPLRGLIRTNQTPIIRLAENMGITP